ncbi:MAG: hypothetical protein IT179_13525 [Acidobacteria bacterium]|nr:hypothetical protein [Acidobacteriota bacterium]
MHRRLCAVLDGGFVPSGTAPHGPWPHFERFTGIQFSVLRMDRGDSAPKRSRTRAATRAALLAAGRYRLLVDTTRERGTLSDLVTWLTLALLTAPGMVVVSRCPAPAPGDWTRRCHRLVVARGQGRPRQYCSVACRVRTHAAGRARERGL